MISQLVALACPVVNALAFYYWGGELCAKGKSFAPIAILTSHKTKSESLGRFA